MHLVTAFKTYNQTNLYTAFLSRRWIRRYFLLSS